MFGCGSILFGREYVNFVAAWFFGYVGISAISFLMGKRQNRWFFINFPIWHLITPISLFWYLFQTLAFLIIILIGESELDASRCHRFIDLLLIQQFLLIGKTGFLISLNQYLILWFGMRGQTRNEFIVVQFDF